ncbi:MAG: prenyltransferase/squalene oxidase repeat-containing protein [Planctomycetaceae bacterium]
MTPEPYLIRLAQRLSAGLAAMAPDRKARHRAFLRSQQMPDGGYRGREGDSDLYYTSFAVRSLVMLGGMNEDECRRVGGFVKSHTESRLSVIDLVSWLSTGLAVQLSGGEDVFADAAPDFAGRIAATLESVRTRDGGYAKTTEGAAGSTYHSFLVALIYEFLGRSVPDPNRLIQFLYDRQRDDGGFVEIAPMKRSGTNPTAAAVALLTMLGAMDDELKEDVREFLHEVRSGDGGFQANTRIPFPDGLSTFTGLLTAIDLGLDDVFDAARTRRLLTDPQHGLELPAGGFRGAAWDVQADVEYTFYGLGGLALLLGRMKDEG